MSIINGNKKVSIIEQLSGYNADNIEQEIKSLKKTLEEHQRLNIILKEDSNEIDKNISNIEFFVENYSDQVQQQEKELKSLFENLKLVILENKKLEESNEKLKETEQKEEIIEIANKLKNIKKLKKEMEFFLEENGI
jgi:hypothetical protein